MKSYLFAIAFFTSIIPIIIISCKNSSAEKITFNETGRAYPEDSSHINAGFPNQYQQLKAAAYIKFKANTQKIISLQTKLKSAGGESLARFEKQVDEFDQRNVELKTRIDRYKEDTKENWELFRNDFNQEMNDLDRSIAAVAEKNLAKD